MRKEEIPTELPFVISSRTARMLGRENVSSSNIALLEIVKNAYDADAKSVNIEFKFESTEPYIIISDDGDGMSFDELHNHWMVVGTNIKEREPKSKKGRIKVGKKGIGRLALDSLAEKAVIKTYTKNVDYGLELSIDWTKYDDFNILFHDVKHPLKILDKNNEKGTKIILKTLRDHWNEETIYSLREDLKLLIPPLAIQDFVISLNVDKYSDLSGPIESSWEAIAYYKLQSELYEDGTISHTLTHRDGTVKNDKRKWHEAFSDKKPGALPETGPCNFTVLFFLRTDPYLKKLKINQSDVDKILKSYQGIRIYRDFFRVKPYGDPSGGHDWLGLNLRRAGSPEGVGGSMGGWRAAENQIIGTVSISRLHNPNIEDKTDREGLFENNAYDDLKRFIIHGIAFLELERQKKEKETPTKKKSKKEIQEKIRETKKELEDKAEMKKKEKKEEDAKDYDKYANDMGEIGEEVEAIQEQQQLLMGLATLGIAMAAFGHETKSSVNQIANRIVLMNDTCKNLPMKEKQSLENDLTEIKFNISAINNWGNFALDHVNRDKRTRKSIDINSIIKKTLEYFDGSFKKKEIKIFIDDLDKSIPKIRAFPMDLESIIINFITNSIEAMKHIPLDKRAIRIKTRFDKENNIYILTFGDSGAGILETDLKNIFNPFFSTRVDSDGKPNGTGLGLTIVNEIVEDYYGTIAVNNKCDLGGAEFTIIFPRKVVN